MTQGLRGGGCPYIAAEWAEKGIKCKRLSPCPHCGSVVLARERRWTARSSGDQMVFREARCVREDCGWHYFRHGGTREEFLAEVNRRSYGDQG